MGVHETSAAVRIWNRVLSEIEEGGDNIYLRLVKPLEVTEDSFVLSVPAEYVQSIMQERYLSRIMSRIGWLFLNSWKYKARETEYITREFISRPISRRTNIILWFSKSTEVLMARWYKTDLMTCFLKCWSRKVSWSFRWTTGAQRDVGTFGRRRYTATLGKRNSPISLSALSI